MNTTTRTTFTSAREANRGAYPVFSPQDVYWIAAFAVLAGGLLALLHGVVGPAPIPERLLDALVFGGVLVLIEALLQSRGLRDMLALILAAVAVATLGAFLTRIGALVIFVVSLVSWGRHDRRATPSVSISY